MKKMLCLTMLIAVASMTPARAEPPEFTGPVARGQCPKGFIKMRGDCWRRIDDSGMGPTGFIDPAADEQDQAEFLEWLGIEDAPRERGKGRR